MALKNVQRSTLAAEAAHELERMIVTGEWQEGTKIPAEPRLMEQLGVSRNTVREAVRALCHIGLLEARPGDGTYVMSTSVLGASLARRLASCDLRETLETRLCLEREAVRLAAERRSAEDVAVLREGILELQRALADGETVEELTARAFRQELRLVRASRNPLLIELYETLGEPIRWAIAQVVETLIETRADFDRLRALHRELVDAIDAGAGDTAERVVTEKSSLILAWIEENTRT